MKIKNPVYAGFLLQMDIIMIKRNKPLLKTAVAVTSMLLAVSLAGAPLTAAAKVEDDGIYTQDGLEDYMAEVSRNKAQAVETNLDPAWPHGPAIGAAGAVVMDADSGAGGHGRGQRRSPVCKKQGQTAVSRQYYQSDDRPSGL